MLRTTLKISKQKYGIDLYNLEMVVMAFPHLRSRLWNKQLRLSRWCQDEWINYTTGNLPRKLVIQLKYCSQWHKAE